MPDYTHIKCKTVRKFLFLSLYNRKKIYQNEVKYNCYSPYGLPSEIKVLYFVLKQNNKNHLK